MNLMRLFSGLVRWLTPTVFGIDDAALVAGGGALAGGLFGAFGANQAAKTQAQAAQNALMQNEKLFNIQYNAAEPWRNAGKSALLQLSDLTAPGSDFMKPFDATGLVNEPGYQFGLDEGRRALEQSAVAGGGLFSGKTMRDLMKFGEDYAGTKYNDAFSRDLAAKGAKYNWLSGLAGTGQAAVGQQGQAAGLFGNQASDLITGAGAARAAGQIGGANAIGQGISNAGNLYLQQSLIDKFMGGGGGGGGGFMGGWTSPQNLNDMATYYGTAGY